MSNQSEENARFVTCQCRHCAGHIEFDANELKGRESAQVECPHCHLETGIFVPLLQKPPLIPPRAQAQAVRGTILVYTIQTNAGIISGDDGQRYSFQGAEWKETAKYPTKGMRVDFAPQSGVAMAIYLIHDITSAPTPGSPSQVLQKKGVLQFQNPENGFTDEVSDAPLWVLLLGCFYFAAKGVWTHAVVGFLAALCTCGVSWLIYPFFADQIMRTHYLQKGWILISESEKNR